MENLQRSQETTHTPGPYRVVPFDDEFFVETPSAIVCTIWNGTDRAVQASERQANAEFIAHACNSYWSLLTALRQLVRAWDSTSFPVSDRMEDALQDADVAIQKAEGRPHD